MQYSSQEINSGVLIWILKSVIPIQLTDVQSVSAGHHSSLLQL